MTSTTTSRIDMLGISCGIGYLFLIFVGWGLIAGFLLPPMAPSLTAEEVAAIYQSDYTRIRIGMLFVMLSAMVFLPYAATVAKFVARVEGGPGTLTYTFLLGAAGNMCLSFYPAIWWLVAAFRPDRTAELIYLMNDMAWLQLIGGVTIYLAMPLALMVAAFCDDSADPIFPRWAGYANGWFALLIIPDQLLFFFHEGPFAWNGLFGLWLPVTGFGGFFLVNYYVVRQRILRERGSPPVVVAQPLPG